ncbi:MAG: hypothetical protein WC648_04065 [Candidatus Paceibacterota bacterium]|jgi:hypothetical protein
MTQTIVQKIDAIRYGSTKVEIGLTLDGLINIGAIRGMKFEHKGENVEIEFDNVDPIKYFKQGDRASFTFTAYETDLTTLSITDGGSVEITTTAGTLVTGETQTAASGTWDYLQFIELDNQNYSDVVAGSYVLTAPFVATVSGSVDGLLTQNDDWYEVLNGAEDKWGVMIKDTSAVTTAGQLLTIVYDYKPLASKTVTFNSFGRKDTYYARVTNTDSEGATFVITLQDVTNIKALSMPFPGDDAEDVLGIEMELHGKIVNIVDTQSII